MTLMRSAQALHALPRVAHLAGTTGDCIRVFAEAQTVPIPAPVLLDAITPLPPLTQDITSRLASHIDPMFLAKLHDVTVTGARDLVTEGGVYLTDLWNQAGLHAAPPHGPRAVEGRVERVEQSAGFLFHNSSSGDNHSHWLLQTLPQLGYFERAGVRPERLVVQPNIRPYQRDVLRAFGYGEDSLLIRHPDQPIVFRELYAGYVDGGLIPDATVFDRQIAAFAGTERGPERIYVSRQDARGIRRFLNEEDLIGRLRALGFAIVVPSTLSAAEEVTVFRDARLIVGPLGAGLYNALFTRPGATIIGLSDPHYVMEWLPQAAALRGHAHGWMFGLSFDSVEPVYGGTHNNWIIDIARVVRELEHFIGR